MLRRTALIGGSAALLIVFFLSPLSLLVLGRLFDVDWNELSSIGQSYTGPAALLSGAALLALALTVRLQAQQARTAQLHSVRSLQFELLGFAFQNAELFSVVGNPAQSDREIARVKLDLYRVMTLRYLQFVFITGDTPEAEIDLILEREFFLDRASLRWWERVAPFWEAQSTASSGTRRFYALVSRSVGAARARLEEGDGNTQED